MALQPEAIAQAPFAVAQMTARKTDNPQLRGKSV
jgi:hypothetical protein